MKITGPVAKHGILGLPASHTNYDPTVSGLTSTDVQDAIDELQAEIDAFTGGIEVKEIDGTPDVTDVAIIQVPNGSLTDNTGGNVTLSYIPGSAQFPIGAVFDAGTSAISGSPSVDVPCPASGTLVSWTLLADVATGNATIDVLKSTYSGFAGSLASIVNVGSGGVKPALSGVIKNTDSSLAFWTTSITAGDIIRFTVDSSTTKKRLEIQLLYTRS